MNSMHPRYQRVTYLTKDLTLLIRSHFLENRESFKFNEVAFRHNFCCHKHIVVILTSNTFASSKILYLLQFVHSSISLISAFVKYGFIQMKANELSTTYSLYSTFTQLPIIKLSAPSIYQSFFFSCEIFFHFSHLVK